jgi:hypothetical protein
MNSPCSPRSGRTVPKLKALVAFGLLTATATANDEVPRGTLSVDRDLVRVGTHSQLDWNIEYPSGVTELVEIVPPNRIVAKENLRMKVRVLGVTFQSGRSRLPVDAYWSKNGSSWDRFFYGCEFHVEPDRQLLSERVRQGDVIDFGARAWAGRWQPFHHTRRNDPHVTVLKDGDAAPDYAPAYDQNSIDGFLKPYVRGNRIAIGERDLIVLWELSASQPGSAYFDMQDLVVLLTFE